LKRLNRVKVSAFLHTAKVPDIGRASNGLAGHSLFKNVLFQIINSFAGPADGMDFAVKQAMARGATLSARTFFCGRGFQPRSSRLESRSHGK
jgi:hypothetical protein